MVTSTCALVLAPKSARAADQFRAGRLVDEVLRDTRARRGVMVVPAWS
jgi:hypothetical protein